MKNKKGQFFLIMAFIILGLIAGVVTVSNSVEKKTDPRFSYTGDELDFESEKVIDYSIGNNRNVKLDLTDFVKNYSNYSNADDFYYIFGTASEITFAGLKKKSSGTLQYDIGSGDQTITLNQGEFEVQNLGSGTSVNLTLNEIKYPFTLNTGQNFYFIVSKEVGGDVYVSTSDKNVGVSSGTSGGELTQRIMFVSSAIYDGSLNGLSGADIECNDLADDNIALRGNVFVAWLSTSSLNAKERVTGDVSLDFVRTDGIKIADDLNDLIDRSIDNPINRNELGNQITSGTFDVWTGTNFDGTVDVNHCNGWTTSGINIRGERGDLSKTDESWTEVPDQSEEEDHPCNNQKRIYCFQIS